MAPTEARGGVLRRLLGRADRLADPNRRTVRWLGFVGVTAAAITGVAALFGLFGGDADERPAVPRFTGGIAHLASGTAMDVADALEKGAVVELHLTARPGDVVSSQCEGGLDACAITWALECEGTEAADLGDDFLELINACGSSFSIRTLDEDGEDVSGWEDRRGAWGLDGYFAVEGTAFNMGVVTAAVREVPPEVARQIVR